MPGTDPDIVRDWKATPEHVADEIAAAERMLATAVELLRVLRQRLPSKGWGKRGQRQPGSAPLPPAKKTRRIAATRRKVELEKFIPKVPS